MVRLAAVLALILISTAALAEITGRAQVIDGDTLKIDGRRIGLYGIDAPEPAQQCRNRRNHEFDCGAIATRTLMLLITGQSVRCEERGGEARGRTLAVCRIGRIDLAEQMVLQGWALADPESGQDYARAEAIARSLPEGLWKIRFVPPWEWRQSAQ